MASPPESRTSLFVKTMVMIGLYISTEIADGNFDIVKPQVIALTKALPALYLSYHVVTSSGANPFFAFYPKIFGIGLLFCAFGDAALRLELAFPANGDIYFLTGIAFFLVGHLFFTMGFQYKHGNLSRLSSSATFGSSDISAAEPSWWPFALVCAFCGSMMYTLVPSIGPVPLKIGVSVYSAVIGTMFFHSIRIFRLERRAISALENSSVALTTGQSRFLRSLVRAPPPEDDAAGAGTVVPAGNGLSSLPSYFVGTVLFVMSDSILGYAKFVEQTNRPFSVLSLYFSSLVFIAHGALGTEGIVLETTSSSSKLGGRRKKVQ